MHAFCQRRLRGSGREHHSGRRANSTGEKFETARGIGCDMEGDAQRCGRTQQFAQERVFLRRSRSDVCDSLDRHDPSLSLLGSHTLLQMPSRL